MKPQLPSHDEVRGGCRWLTYTTVENHLPEITKISQVEKFYTNISLVIMDIVLNTSSSLQINAFSYLNIHFCIIVPATGLLRLHVVSLLHLQSLLKLLSTNKDFFLNRNKIQPCSEQSLPRFLVLHFGSDTHCCHTYTPCSMNLMFTETLWRGH